MSRTAERPELAESSRVLESPPINVVRQVKQAGRYSVGSQAAIDVQQSLDSVWPGIPPSSLLSKRGSTTPSHTHTVARASHTYSYLYGHTNYLVIYSSSAELTLPFGQLDRADRMIQEIEGKL